MSKRRKYPRPFDAVNRSWLHVALSVALVICACSGSSGPVAAPPTEDPGTSLDAVINPDVPPPVSVAGDRVVTSQADVDSLPKGTAFSIAGDLLIEGVADIDLAGLDSLVQIGGNLSIRDNPGLRRPPLDGLQQLTGDLVLRNNPALVMQDAFPVLTHVGGSVVVADNGPGDLDGFGILDQLGGDLSITGHDGLGSVSGFRRLIRIGGSLLIQANNATALRLPGLARLARVEGHVQVESNTVDTLEGPRGLLSVGGTLELSDNEVHVLAGFDQLGLIEGSLVVADDDSLRFVEAWANLLEVGGELSIRGLPRLSTVAFLNELIRVDGRLEIADNAAVENIKLPALQRAGSLTVSCDPQDCRLHELNLEELTRVHGDLVISGTHLLDLDGLDHLRTVEGDLILQFNDVLEDIQGLAGLDTLGGDQAHFINREQPLDQIADLIEQLRDNGFEGDVQIVGGFSGLTED